jgi:lipoprotein-releasing system ATP-binding protein
VKESQLIVPDDQRAIPNTPIVLSAERITKNFRTATQALIICKDINLEVLSGEVVSIQGASGSGKTTLLNIFGGLEQADSGSLYWEGESVCANAQSLEKKRAQFLGYVFQAYYLIPELNVLENVLMTRRIGKTMDDFAEDAAVQLLKRVGLGGHTLSLPEKLSGGERQRVAIARALIHRPKLLLADEPTGNLDEKTAGSVFECLLGLVQEEKAAMILVTHSPILAEKAHRSFCLKDGHLG